MQVTRNRKIIVILGCLLAFGICFYNPMVEMPREEVVAFLEPRIHFLKSVRFTILDNSLDMILDWIKTSA